MSRGTSPIIIPGAEQAISWARSKMGSGDWNEYCLRFVANAYRGRGPEPEGEWSSALDAAQKLPLFDQNKQGWLHAPRGALLFFKGTTDNKYGHVGIYLGDGDMIHAYGTVRIDAVAKVEGLNQVGPYYGWTYPPEKWKVVVTNVTLTLYVHESSASGPVISGAMVIGQDGAGKPFSQVTNSIGYVTITGVPGTWSFTASKSGYNSNSWSQSITTTDTKHAYLVKPVAPVTLTLYVHENSASGPIISGAQVTGQDGAGTSFSQVTNSSGYVTITGVPGTWSFTASKSGYQTNSWSQSITSTSTKHAYLLK